MHRREQLTADRARDLGQRLFEPGPVFAHVFWGVRNHAWNATENRKNLRPGRQIDLNAMKGRVGAQV